jgi:hypothetical protein
LLEIALTIDAALAICCHSTDSSSAGESPEDQGERGGLASHFSRV